MATATRPDHKRYPVGKGYGLTRTDDCMCDECIARRESEKRRRERMIVLQGVQWLEGVKLAHTLQDPWADVEVVARLEQFYPGGWKKFLREWIR